jgi:hypothetical protein
LLLLQMGGQNLLLLLLLWGQQLLLLVLYVLLLQRWLGLLGGLREGWGHQVWLKVMVQSTTE